MADFSRFFHTSHELLATADEAGRFVDLNQMWTRVLGHSPDELRAVPFLEFVHPDDREATTAEVGHLTQLYTDIAATNKPEPGKSWMTLSCFAVLTSVESVFY